MSSTAHTEKAKAPKHTYPLRTYLVAGALAVLALGAVAVAVPLIIANSSSSDPVPQTVQISFTAAGDPSDYPESVQSSLLAALAVAAGYSSTPAGAEIRITAASVDIVATFPVESATAAQAARDLLQVLLRP